MTVQYKCLIGWLVRVSGIKYSLIRKDNLVESVVERKPLQTNQLPRKLSVCNSAHRLS